MALMAHTFPDAGARFLTVGAAAVERGPEGVVLRDFRLMID
jgi:hypothetical protein